MVESSDLEKLVKNSFTMPLDPAPRKVEDLKKIIMLIVKKLYKKAIKKSPIRETKHILTDANSTTNTTVGWTKNTQKPDFFEKGKIFQNSKTSRNMSKLAICPLTRGL